MKKEVIRTSFVEEIKQMNEDSLNSILGGQAGSFAENMAQESESTCFDSSGTESISNDKQKKESLGVI